MTKRTYQPSVEKRIKTHGFMSRNRFKKGRKLIKRKILKGRKKIF